MAIDDYLPPHEARSGIGQLGDAGGGVVPALTPTPAPGAMASTTPGIGPGAAQPPTLPSDDPQRLVLLLQQLANTMFNGGATPPTSIAPVTGAAPTSPQVTATPSPVVGISPQLVAMPVDVPGTPSAPTAPNGVPTFGGAFDPSLDPLAGFSLPVLDTVPIDATPSYVPPHDAVGLDTAAPSFTDFQQLDATPDPLIRDLGGSAFDPYAVRRDFPILEERVHGKRLVWLDNAATTQKPRAVIDRIKYFYEHENSNIHRAAHTLAARATDAYENARESTRKFINARSTSEIIFVRGATEGLNLIAQSWGRRYVGAGDEILITHLEHHANIVPWQMLAADKGARLRVAPVDDRGDIIVEEFERLLSPKTKLVSLPQVSNALGTVTPAKELVAIAKRYGATVVVDGAQSISHMRVDVQDLDADFFVFSGHKVFAPTGIGAVWGKKEVLEHTPPWQGGGNMIADVTFEKTVYQPPPFRFEAGTGNIADAVGMGAALDYVSRIGIDVIDRYEHDLMEYATEHLLTVPGLSFIGNPRIKAGVLSFVLDGQRTEDVGSALDKEGIAVRSGHHCAQPILRRFGVEASVRASLAFYNVCEDIDALVDALRRLQAGHP